MEDSNSVLAGLLAQQNNSLYPLALTNNLTKPKGKKDRIASIAFNMANCPGLGKRQEIVRMWQAGKRGVWDRNHICGLGMQWWMDGKNS
jgi:hypothetical protein